MIKVTMYRKFVFLIATKHIYLFIKRKFDKLYTIPMASNNCCSFSGSQSINVLLFLQLDRTLQYNVTSTVCQGISQ